MQAALKETPSKAEIGHELDFINEDSFVIPSCLPETGQTVVIYNEIIFKNILRI